MDQQTAYQFQMVEQKLNWIYQLQWQLVESLTALGTAVGADNGQVTAALAELKAKTDALKAAVVAASAGS